MFFLVSPVPARNTTVKRAETVQQLINRCAIGDISTYELFLERLFGGKIRLDLEHLTPKKKEALRVKAKPSSFFDGFAEYGLDPGSNFTLDDRVSQLVGNLMALTSKRKEK